MSKISGCMIVYNEESCIRRALENLSRFADEIIILDSFSTDSTLEIAKEYGCKIFQHKLESFTEQKNKALSLCSNDWVINLDADEYLNNYLVNNISNILEMAENNGADICKIKLINFLDGKFLSGPEFKSRIINKKTAKFYGGLVHELVKGNKEIQIEDGFIIHDKTLKQQFRSNAIYYYINPEKHGERPHTATNKSLLNKKESEINIYDDIISKLEWIPTTEHNDGLWIIKDKYNDNNFSFRENTLDKDIYNSIIEGNEYNLNFNNIKDIIGPIMDVGAHIGSFSKLLRQNNYKGNIYAYEAHPDNFSLLKKNFIDDEKVNVLSGGVWKNDLEELNITKSTLGNSGGLSVLINQNETVKIKSIDFDKEVGNITAKEQKNIALLKIDCEGAEFEILLNSSKLDAIDNIIGEYHNWQVKDKVYHFEELVNHLQQNKFDVYYIPHDSDPNLGIFFATKKDADLKLIKTDKFSLFEKNSLENINFNIEEYLKNKEWNKSQEIGVFYYLWYNNDTWKNMVTRKNYGSPSNGWYNSIDENIIKNHFLIAEENNIDFFITAYHGEEKEKIALETVIEYCEKNHSPVKIAPHLELVNVLGDPVPSDQKTFNWLVEAIKYFCELDVIFPNALKKIDNKTVIYIYTSRRLQSNLSELDRLRQFIKKEYNKELYIIGDEIWWEIKNENYHQTILQRMNKFDAIYGYSLFVPHGYFNNNSYIGEDYISFVEEAYKWFYNNTDIDIFPVIKPRFNDKAVRKGNYPIPPENGKFFMDYYNMTQKYYKNNKTLLITSFNEWYEDTQIEPFISNTSVPMNNYDLEVGYNDKYLKMLKYFKI